MARCTLELNIADDVAEIRLCRPELLNRFDMPLHLEMTAVMEELALDRQVRAVVLCSTGRYFSAGGDTDTMLEAAQDIGHRLAMIDEGRRLFRAFADFPKPLIVALEGNSYGLATTLILLADVLVASPKVEFSDPHVRMGLVAGDGGLVAWVTATGMIKAKRHLLTGDPLRGEEAHRLGIVTDLVENPQEVLPTAHAIARRIAQMPPLAVQLTKRALNKIVMLRAEEVFDLGMYLEGITFGTEDMLEAVAAFKEKRPATFKGK